MKMLYFSARDNLYKPHLIFEIISYVKSFFFFKYLGMFNHKRDRSSHGQ